VTEFPTLVYIIAKTPHYYRGDISDQVWPHSGWISLFLKDAVKAWLEVLDEVTISKPKDFEQVTRIFQDVSGENCDSKYLLMLNNEKKCPFPNWPILARFVYIWPEIRVFRQVESKHQIRPAEIFAPITTDTKVALYRRMPHLPQTLCRTLILLTQGSYSFLPDILSIAEVFVHEPHWRLGFLDFGLAGGTFSIQLIRMWQSSRDSLATITTTTDGAGAHFFFRRAWTSSDGAQLVVHLYWSHGRLGCLYISV
jgi:hypothetical protein